jgi:hypothetical protein
MSAARDRLEEPAPDAVAEPVPVVQALPGPATVLSLQRSAGNQYVRRLLEADAGGRLQRADATATVNPTPAVEALDRWRVKQEKLINGTGTWASLNWVDFLDSASQNPSLAVQDTWLAEVGSNAFGNAISGTGGALVTRTLKRSPALLGSAIGTLAEPGVGTLVGYLIGVLVESTAAFAFEAITGSSDLDETSAETAKRVGKLIQERELLLAEQTQQDRDYLEMVVRIAKETATSATTEEDVQRVLTWAEAEERATPAPPAATDRGLMKELLSAWVLEHAGDVDTVHGAASAAQWEAAKDEMFGEGAIAGHPEMLAFQTRSEWQRMGIDYEAEATRMMTKTMELVKAAEGAPDPAAVVQAYFHGKKYYFQQVRDEDALMHYLTSHYQINTFHNEGHVYPLDDYREAIKTGKVKVECELDIAVSEGSAYVDEWNMVIEFDIIASTPPPNNIHRCPFDVWPTWG